MAFKDTGYTTWPQRSSDPAVTACLEHHSVVLCMKPVLNVLAGQVPTKSSLVMARKLELVDTFCGFN